MIKFYRQIRQSMINQNRTKKYLLYAIGEIILVVIGILIALQINNWNENRKSAKQENLYLKRLLSENKEDVNTFKSNIADLEKGIETIENLSFALNSVNSSDEKLVLAANDFFGYGSIYPIFTSSTSTFDDLSSTGNLKDIRNSNLRDELVKHYAKHKQVAEWIRIGTEWALPNDAPFTYNNSIMRFEPASAFLFGEQNQSELADHLKEKKEEYINNAAVHYWINKDAIGKLENLIADTNRIIDLIQQELKN
ncbi:DUF6090 family protein [Winogradskyella sp.]|uniref:DUF6090 family protein n=1 Tax=Winogradskyella sp. TaxID=1883156 RepID=UPI001B11A3B9|nr:DUF6090 family protein [Winogradskyella sp.]MBO6881439.1 hypothetical protein [Winogradskyella sp.]